MFERRRIARVGIPLLFCTLFFGLQSLMVKSVRGQTEPQIVVADGSDLNKVFAQGTRAQIPPQQLYYRAWHLIKESYYRQTGDEAYGGQDWNRWEHHYDGKLKTSDDAHKAIETMLASLGDPYTRFLDRDAFDDEKSQIDAHLFGVGMQLGMNKEKKVVVIAPIEDTPAWKAGILAGDEIIEVDGKPVKGQSLDAVVKQIRGTLGTKVSITCMRKLERRKSLLQRAEIPIKAVATSEMLPSNIGYIRLDSFISSKANSEMRTALKKLSGADGIILDLRNNPGGLLANAIDIASMFLDRGVIVSTIDSDGYKNSTPASGQPLTHQPVVLLINGGSASASEILSGALRDNQRAKLVGDKSFGKGLVQAINKLEDGSGINVTIARYLTPNDTDIHKQGITPDFRVKLEDADYTKGKGPWWFDPTFNNFKKSPSDGKDVQLNKAIEVMKDTISKAQGRTTAQAPAEATKN